MNYQLLPSIMTITLPSSEGGKEDLEKEILT